MCKNLTNMILIINTDKQASVYILTKCNDYIWLNFIDYI